VTGSNLEGELAAALWALPDVYATKLVAMGADPLDVPILVGRAHVLALAGGLYEPGEEDDRDAIEALISPIKVDSARTPESLVGPSAIRFGTAVDLVAYFPKRPGEFLLRRGAASWLGCTLPSYSTPRRCAFGATRCAG
jgi:hypothetical protein